MAKVASDGYISLSLSLSIYIYIYIYIYIDLLLRRLIIIHPGRPEKSCMSWPNGATNLHRLRGQILHDFNDFGMLGGSFLVQVCMPEATLKDHGSSHAKCCENVAKTVA